MTSTSRRDDDAEGVDRRRTAHRTADRRRPGIRARQPGGSRGRCQGGLTVRAVLDAASPLRRSVPTGGVERREPAAPRGRWLLPVRACVGLLAPAVPRWPSASGPVDAGSGGGPIDCDAFDAIAGPAPLAATGRCRPDVFAPDRGGGARAAAAPSRVQRPPPRSPPPRRSALVPDSPRQITLAQAATATSAAPVRVRIPSIRRGQRAGATRCRCAPATLKSRRTIFWAGRLVPRQPRPR